MSFTPWESSVGDIRQALNSGVSCEEVFSSFAARIQAYDQQDVSLNALTWLNANATMEARALDFIPEEERGVLHCVPLLIKDNVDVEGAPTTAGCVSLRDSYPLHSAPLVRRLQREGGVVLAKTNLPDFALDGSNTLSSLSGQTRNPYAPSHTTWGSSGGTGAAVAASFGVVGVGSDTMGSITLPSSAQSLYGLRPTHDAVASQGTVPLFSMKDSFGPMCRTAQDTATAWHVMSGHQREEVDVEAVRLGYLSDYLRPSDAPLFPAEQEVIDAMRDMKQRYADAGVEVKDVVGFWPFTGLSLASASAACRCATSLQKEDLNEYLASLGADAPVPDLDALIERAYQDLPDSHESAIEWLQHVNNQTLAPEDNPDCWLFLSDGRRPTQMEMTSKALNVLMEWHQVDVLIYPANSRLPNPIGEMEKQSASASVCSSVMPQQQFGMASAHLSADTGWPSMQMPAEYGGEHGLPVGVTFLARAHQEEVLLQLAERHQELFHRSPPKWTPPL